MDARYQAFPPDFPVKNEFLRKLMNGNNSISFQVIWADLYVLPSLHESHSSLICPRLLRRCRGNKVVEHVH